MSNHDSTTEQAPATVPQILAHLIVLGQQLGLPDPRNIHANGDDAIAGVDVRNLDEVKAWADALGIAEKVHSYRMGDAAGPQLAGQWHHDAYAQDLRGWSVNVSAITPGDDLAKPIDHDVLTTLETIAAVYAEADHLQRQGLS